MRDTKIPCEEWADEKWLQAMAEEFPALFNYMFKSIKRWNKYCLDDNYLFEPSVEDQIADNSIIFDVAAAICHDFERDAHGIGRAIIANYEYKEGK